MYEFFFNRYLNILVTICWELLYFLTLGISPARVSRMHENGRRAISCRANGEKVSIASTIFKQSAVDEAAIEIARQTLATSDRRFFIHVESVWHEQIERLRRCAQIQTPSTGVRQTQSSGKAAGLFVSNCSEKQQCIASSLPLCALDSGARLRAPLF